MIEEGSSYSSETDSTEIAGLMHLVIKRSGSGYFLQDTDERVLLCGNLPAHFAPLETAGKTERDLLTPHDSERFAIVKNTVISNGQPASIEVDIATPTGMLTYRIDIDCLEFFGEKSILSVISDVTETRHRERVLKTLLRELSHRSKNLLAIIQGIATQTARQAFSLDSFLSKFRGRIQSLASSQDLVTDSSWRGAYLFSLVNRQLSTYRGAQDAPFALTGIDAHLSPNAALHIGLALHELIVNSASHGAIAAGASTLTLDCFETTFENASAIELAWIEQIPREPASLEVEEHSFARTVLERVVPVAVGGKALYVRTPDRVEYRLTVPAREYEIIARIDG